MHHLTIVLRQQACKAEPSAALPQPQPQTDARARAAAQHAKAKQAQLEYRRLQYHFAQLQQHGRVYKVHLGMALPETRLLRLLDACRLRATRAPTYLRLPIQLRLALQGAGAAVATGSVGCGRGAPGEAATAAAGLRR